MSTILTTTSTTRPTGNDVALGDLYYETDTTKLIVWTGTGWSTFSPTSQGASVSETSEENPLPITYGTLDEVINAQDPQLGDFFIIPATTATATIRFQESLANSTYFYLTDESGTSFTFDGKIYSSHVTSSHPLRFDLDAANYGTSDWQGSTNLKNVIESPSHFGTSSFNITISGDNNEIINLELPNPGKLSHAFCADSKNESINFNGGRNIELLIYKGENNFLTFSSDS